MILNSKYKFMFFAESHTASRACSKMLLKIPESKSIGHHHMTQEYADSRDLLPQSGYLKFSVIRDPRDIIATQIAHAQYNYKTAAVVSNPTPTDAELVERYVKAACDRESFFYHDPDYVIRYERLNPGIFRLLCRLGVNCVDLKLEKFGMTAEKKSWWEYFSRSQLARMRKNIPEIEQFKEL